MTKVEQVARSAKIGRRLLVAVASVGCVLGVYAFAVNVNQGKDITNVHNEVTKIESPCLKYGAKSDQCKEAFEQAVLTITHPEACAIERKAGPPTKPSCIGARLDQERQRRKERTANAPSARGGDAQQPGSTGHQQPSPSPSGGGGSIGDGAGKGGHQGGHAQGHPGGQDQARTSPAPTSQADSGSSPADTQADIPRDIPAPAGKPVQLAPSPLPEAVEAAGGAVEKAAEISHGVVEETGKAAGCVLRGIC